MPHSIPLPGPISPHVKTVGSTLRKVGVRLGWRSGEVRGLLWADVNFEEMTIRISGAMKRTNGKQVREATKTEDSESIMPLPPGLVNVFKALGAPARRA